jgi:hypothetical protein
LVSALQGIAMSIPRTEGDQPGTGYIKFLMVNIQILAKGIVSMLKDDLKGNQKIPWEK